MLCFYDLSFFGNKNSYFVYNDGIEDHGRRHYGRLDSLLGAYEKNLLHGGIVMFCESNFSFFGQQFSRNGDDVLSHGEYLQLLSDAEIHLSAKGGKFLYTYTHNIRVDGVSSDYVVGNQGRIEWDSYFVFLNNAQNYFLKNYLSSLFIVPQSLAMIEHVVSHSAKENFGLLYVLPHVTKYVHVVDGFYESFDILNLGSHSLHRMLGEVGLGFENIMSVNPIADKLRSEVYGFFVSSLIDWLSELHNQDKHLFLVSDLSKDSMFVDVLSERFSQAFQGYVVPLNFGKIAYSSGFDDIDVFFEKLDWFRRHTVFFS